MSSNPKLYYPEGQFFQSFLSRLRIGEDTAWEELIVHFRERTIPYLRKKVGKFNAGSVISADYFIEEVFAASIVKFYELFKTGQFENTGHLRGLMFRIIDNQLLAFYKKKKKEQLITFSENLENNTNKVMPAAESEFDRQNVIQNIEQALKKLPVPERRILHHFAEGGKLKDIASEMKITEAACRKKKQRALGKLKTILKPLLMSMILSSGIGNSKAFTSNHSPNEKLQKTEGMSNRFSIFKR